MKILLALLLLAPVTQAAELQFQFTERAGAANSIQIAGIRLTQNGVPVALPGAVATSDGTYPASEGPGNVLDGDQYSKYLRFTPTQAGTQVTVALTLTSPSMPAFNGYQLMWANDEPNRDPKAWTLRQDGIVVSTVTAAPAGGRLTWSSVFTVGAPPPPPAVASDLCWVVNPLAYTFAKVSAASSIRFQNVVHWQSDCQGKVEVLLYSDDEFKAAVDTLWNTKSRAEFNAWRKTQPVKSYTTSELALVAALRASYAPPAQTLTVQSVSAACDASGAVTTACTRPAYAKKIDGTRNTTAVSGVRVKGGVACSADRIGTTNYYLVPSVGYYAVCVSK